MLPMGKTIQLAADRAFDRTKTVLPAEVARGIYMQNPPGLAALKLMQQAGCNMDNALIASNFRWFCRERGLSPDAAGIEQIFADYCNKIGVLP